MRELILRSVLLNKESHPSLFQLCTAKGSDLMDAGCASRTLDAKTPILDVAKHGIKSAPIQMQKKTADIELVGIEISNLVQHKVSRLSGFMESGPQAASLRFTTYSVVEVLAALWPF
jgi:hypothetical protein